MLQRLGIVFGLMLLLMLALHGCTPGYYLSLQMTKINGKPYMMVEYTNPSFSENNERFFGVFSPKGERWDEWEPVVSDRLGRAYVLFPAQAKPAATPEVKPDDPAEPKHPPPPPQAERLGVLHEQRVTYFDASANPPALSFDTLPFAWKAEASAKLKGVVYAFGVNDAVYETAAHEGKLLIARYDGQKWEELKIESPAVQGNKFGILLQAISTPNGIVIFWRNPDLDVALWPDWEGLRVVTDGPLMMTTFNGESFEKPISVSGLPRGNATAWSDGEMIKLLVQTRHKTEDAVSHNGPMEIWKVGPGGGAEKVEEIEGSRTRGGLLSYLFAEHFTTDDGAEYIVRTNLQLFEVWTKKPDASWARVAFKPRGLPVYDLELMLLAGLAVSVILIAFGAALAYQRRKEALTLARKIRSRDIYASLGLRLGAYVVDLTLVLLATSMIQKLEGLAVVSPVQILLLNREPYWPFLGAYMFYFVNTEWLFGATIGKAIMGLSVVGDGGERITFWSAVVRNLIGFFERLPEVVPLVTVWMIVLGPRRQRMGDVLSRTFVVQKGALEAFKKQRAEELAARKANQQDTRDLESSLLPPLDAPWDDGTGKNRNRDDKGSRP